MGLPAVCQYLSEFSVFYALVRGRRVGNSRTVRAEKLDAKVEATRRMLRSLAPTAEQVVSIGDSALEHQAVSNVVAQLLGKGNVCAKSLRMASTPDAAELISQLSNVQ